MLKLLSLFLILFFNNIHGHSSNSYVKLKHYNGYPPLGKVKGNIGLPWPKKRTMSYPLPMIGAMGYTSAFVPRSLKLVNDADLQSALMPQELNPTFISDKLFQDAPWRAVFPLVGRQRRDLDVVVDSAPIPAATVSHNLKLYSRMATCIALAVAAIVEIILYVVEFYTVT